MILSMEIPEAGQFLTLQYKKGIPNTSLIFLNSSKKHIFEKRSALSSAKSNYYIAIIPDRKEVEKIKILQEDMSEKFGSYKALKNIPHITLVPPFSMNEEDEQKLYSVLLSQCDPLHSFEIYAKGFSHFRKHTIYIEIEVSKPLEHLRNHLIETVNNTENLLSKPIRYFQKFVPHITIGYRDLEPNFKQAWEYFGKLSFETRFDCHSFSLLKHNGEQWEEVKEFGFI